VRQVYFCWLTKNGLIYNLKSIRNRVVTFSAKLTRSEPQQYEALS